MNSESSRTGALGYFLAIFLKRLRASAYWPALKSRSASSYSARPWEASHGSAIASASRLRAFSIRSSGPVMPRVLVISSVFLSDAIDVASRNVWQPERPASAAENAAVRNKLRAGSVIVILDEPREAVANGREREGTRQTC